MKWYGSYLFLSDSFAWHDTLKIHPYGHKWQYFIFSYGGVVFHCIYAPHLFPIINQRTLWWFGHYECGQVIFDKGVQNIKWRKESLFNKWCWKNQTDTCKRMKLDFGLFPYTRMNSKWIRDLSIRPESTTLAFPTAGFPNCRLPFSRTRSSCSRWARPLDLGEVATSYHYCLSLCCRDSYCHCS